MAVVTEHLMDITVAMGRQIIHLLIKGHLGLPVHHVTTSAQSTLAFVSNVVRLLAKKIAYPAILKFKRGRNFVQTAESRYE